MNKTTIVTALAALLLATGAASASQCTDEIENLTKLMSARDAGSGPVTQAPTPPAGTQKGQHPPTDIMSKEAEGSATSPADVRRQTGLSAAASQKLDEARQLDAQGKANECMDAVREARIQSGL